MEKVKGSTWHVFYKGGDVRANLDKVDCLMIYGATGSLPMELVDELRARRVPLILHRRNMVSPAVFLPSLRPDASDLLTRQILVRENKIKSVYIARTLVRSRFQMVNDKVRVRPAEWRKLAGARTHSEVRSIEAAWARRYWGRYFWDLGEPDTTRRSKAPLPNALNACSMFLTGIILRWILVHRLSPVHGYMHMGTDYASLVYDLVEPYRYLCERAVALAVDNNRDGGGRPVTGVSIEILKRLLDDVVHVPLTRQNVRRKNLLHGVVLALRAYLIGDMRRFVPPLEGDKRRGRPVKVSFSLPGNVNR